MVLLFLLILINFYKILRFINKYSINLFLKSEKIGNEVYKFNIEYDLVIELIFFFLNLK